MRYWKPRKITGAPRVSLVVASWLGEPRRLDTLFSLLYSLRAQTYPHWNAVVVHDGPAPDEARTEFSRVLCHDLERITLAETATRLGRFGHPHRHDWACRQPGRYVGFCNDDGWYAPTYLEWLVAELQSSGAGLVHCDLVHSHKLWREFPTAPIAGRIDVGCFLAEKSLVASTPWTDHSFRGDGLYVEALARKAKTARVRAALYVHN